MNKFLSAILIIVICTIPVSACWRLPQRFSSLPLDQKVEAYSVRFKYGGARSLQADNLIAGHGYSAATAMIPYISGKKSGIPPFVAINIVWDVQMKGCDLRGSVAEEALRTLLETQNSQADEQVAAQAALEAIVSGRHSAPASEQLSAEKCSP